MHLLFWLGFGGMFYHIAGYPLILFVLSRFKREKPIDLNQADWPTVCVLCPAYNEEKSIERKIESFLALDYPADKIEMWVISDDSTDNTNQIVGRYTDRNIKLFIQKPRRGKVSGHNMVQPMFTADYIVSTDANAIFAPDAIKQLVATLRANPDAGMAVGRLVLQTPNGDSGEGLYWRYETWLKKLNSRINSINNANGALFMVPRCYFTPLPASSIDDFERTLQILQHHKQAKLNVDATVTEYATEVPIQEIKRKIRIISREWFSLMNRRSLLSPRKYPYAAWMLISHKVMRWLLFAFAGLMLKGAFAGVFSAKLRKKSCPQSMFYLLMLLGQLGLYFAGIWELRQEKKGKPVGALKPAAYFVSMVWASFMAFISFLRGKAPATWSTIREDSKQK